jgi:PKD repeat protein
MRRIISVVMTILFLACTTPWAKDYPFADGMAVTNNGTVAGTMKVIGTHVWLDTGGTLTKAWASEPPECSIPGWKLPSKEELETMLTAAKADSNVEQYLKDNFQIGAGERFLMTRTKVHPDITDESKSGAWEFYGYEIKAGQFKEIETYGVIHQWSGYKKTDMSARYIMDIPLIDYDENEGTTIQFHCPVPNVSNYQWSFGDSLSSDEKSPLHIYSNTGNYKVALTITGMDGEQETATLKMDIREPFGNDKAYQLDPAMIRMTETENSILYPYSPFGYHHLNTANVTALDDGGFAVMYTLESGKTQIAFYSNDCTPSGMVDLAEKGVTAGIASHGDKIAYLYKIGKNRLDFRVLGDDEHPVVIMDNGEEKPDTVGFSNTGKGLVFMTKGKLPFGSEAMFDPVTLGRGNLIYASGKWIASFTHANNFAASSTEIGKYVRKDSVSHWAEYVVSFEESNLKPQLFTCWGVSHCMDLRTVYDGEYIANLSIGDAFPVDFQLAIYTPQGKTISSTSLFGKYRYPDAIMGKDKDGKNLYGVAGGPEGVSASLGELLPASRGEYLLTYRIKPGKYQNKDIGATGYLTTAIDELGVLRLDKDGHILFRRKLVPGNNVDFLKTARFGKNFLIAWKETSGKESDGKKSKKKETEVPVYKMMTIDGEGNILDGPVTLPEKIFFNASDPFVVLRNGDIVWTAAGYGADNKKGKMLLFQLKLE